MKNVLDETAFGEYDNGRPRKSDLGGVAQLGERSVRIREVEGSNPFVSIEGETSQHSESLVK